MSVYIILSQSASVGCALGSPLSACIPTDPRRPCHAGGADPMHAHLHVSFCTTLHNSVSAKNMYSLACMRQTAVLNVHDTEYPHPERVSPETDPRCGTCPRTLWSASSCPAPRTAAPHESGHPRSHSTGQLPGKSLVVLKQAAHQPSAHEP